MPYLTGGFILLVWVLIINLSVGLDPRTGIIVSIIKEKNLSYFGSG